MKVALRFDASHERGLGHFYRCLALAEELRKRGHEPVFVARIYPETAEALMRCEFELVSLKPECSEQEDTNAIISTEADAIIVDMLDTSTDYMQKLKAKCKFLLTLDNNGEGTKIADKTINVLYNHINEKNIISDSSYAILRKQFADIHNHQKQINENARKIHVMQGGADTHGILKKILNALDGSDYEIMAVAGIVFKETPSENKKLKVYRNVNNPEALMLEADIAVTAAGISMMELLCVGTPSIAVCGERFEEETAKKLEKRGAVVNLGFGLEVPEEKIRSAIDDLAKDYKKRKKMSYTGKQLIDGKGAERVADIIEKGIQRDD